MTGQPPSKLFLTQREAWELLGVSRATWYRLRREGRVPEPCLVGSYPKWRRADLLSWAAGLPTTPYQWRRAVHA
jgi:predicted DNA-binding transcriptional regulator AlpA